MVRHTACAVLLCAALLPLRGAAAQLHHGGGSGQSAGGGSAHSSGGRFRGAPGFRGSRFAGPFGTGPVAVTRPVDVVWPPVIIEPPDYVASPYIPYTGPETLPAEPEPPAERGVTVKLDDCMDDAPLAGYNFADRRVVSCEDSTVDVYLSFNQEGKYYFLVPEDTQIKDIGPRTDIRSIRMIKPSGWTDDHGALLMAGHAYVVWAASGDLYVLKVDALWEKHAMFSWVWHSRLSREAAEKFLKENAPGPPQGPYYPR